MFNFAASTEYFDWLYSQPILAVGYVRKNYMDLARTLPYYVYIKVKSPKGKEEKIDTDIRLGDAAKGDVPNIKPYKQFVGQTVQQMADAVKSKGAIEVLPNGEKARIFE